MQTKIIAQCNLAGKPVITATQMLDSMIDNSRSDLADVRDIVNAVYDSLSAAILFSRNFYWQVFG